VSGLAYSLATLPNFIAYFGGGSLLTAIFVLLYTNLTPHREVALIRGGFRRATQAGS
jgi:putative membrane protein